MVNHIKFFFQQKLLINYCCLQNATKKGKHAKAPQEKPQTKLGGKQEVKTESRPTTKTDSRQAEKTEGKHGVKTETEAVSKSSPKLSLYGE